MVLEPKPMVLAAERFQIRRILGGGAMGIVYEALDLERKSLVALKTLKNIAAEEIYRFKQEFRSLQDVVHPNLCSLLELVEQNGIWYIVMELVSGVDFLTYTSLAEQGAVTGEAPSSWGGFHENRLRTALSGLARGLAAIHSAGKVHRDVKPSNVLVTQQGRAVILDFGLVLERQDSQSGPLEIVGTPEYMAPELLEPGNVGPAADGYSLGVMMYEALTGHLPFVGSPTQILLDKQLKAPQPPKAQNPRVPPDLNALCVDLLQQDPSRRPTAKEILRRLRIDDSIQSEPPSSILAMDRLTQVSSFVGREQELQELQGAFAETVSGQGKTVIVEGVSGVGKTFLVRRFLQEAYEACSDVVAFSGRCYERESVPFKAFDGIVDALANYLLRQRKEDVDNLVPENAVLLARLFPVLRRVPQVAELPEPVHDIIDPHELRRRAFWSLRDLLKKLTSQFPLVVWIDDMQWTDQDSLLLLKEILPQEQSLPLLLILSTRALESENAAAVSWTRALPCESKTIVLTALDRDSSDLLAQSWLEQMIPGTSSITPAEVYSETHGHPLYITELIRFYAQSGARSSTPLKLDDVILSRVMQLSDTEKKLLSFSCVAGAPMRGDFLMRIATVDEADFLASVSRLKASKLLHGSGVRKSDALEVYHGRVREAVLTRLLSQEQRARMHRDIGEFYLSEFSKSQIESNIYEIVHHLNEGLTSRPEATDRQRMIDLNITAGRRARAATAYRSAAEHYLKAIGFTDDASWQTQYETMISLYVAAAEAANLAGDVDLCASLTQEALRHIQSQPDRARICQVQVLSLIGQDKPDEAIDLALEMMNRLDVHLPRKPSSLHVFWKILKTMWHLRGREVEDFLELPLATDRRIQAARNLMFIIGSPCYLSSPKLWAVVIAEGVCLSIRYGQDPVSAPSFSSYGVINCILLGRFRFGYELGKISMEMARRLEDKSTIPMVDFVFAQFVQHWRDHVEKTLPLMLESHAAAAEIGDIVYAGHAAANYCVHGFFAGVKLGELAADIEKYSEYLRKNKLTVSLNTLFIYQHGIDLLVRAEERENSAGGVDCHDDALIQLLVEDGVLVNLFHAWMITALSQYFFGQYPAAEQSASHAYSLRESATGALGYALFPFIESLIALACCREGTPAARGRRMRKARRSLRKYNKTARNAPMSHMHKYRLVEAELARAKGKTERAMELYAQAVEGALENRFVQDAALACELAGGFCLEIGEEQRARDLLIQAREHYLAWGAIAKARHLEKCFPQIRWENLHD